MSAQIVDVSWDEALERFEAEGLTDGLPVLAPTPARVEEMLAALSDADRRPIGPVPPSNREADPRVLAANAVMAGCGPEHMPVVVAAIRAMLDPAYNLIAVQTTTYPVGPVTIVNGPIRTRAKYRSGSGALGPGFRSNAVTGRAIRFILTNIGGAHAGTIDRATHSYPGKYSFLFAENEEESPWEPLHVTRGFDKDESCVTVAAVAGTVNSVGGERDADDLFDKIAKSMQLPGTNDFTLGRGSPMVVLSPDHAGVFGRAGLSKEDVRSELIGRSATALSWFTPYSQQVARGARRVNEPGDLLRIVENPEDLIITVAGGAGAHTVFAQSFGNSAPLTKRIAS